ncbi:glycosyltransferase [Falsirhodobacter sp. 1013]|uniref:glycosyltransferase n=1 Tax=Falsirhodobacter sp. 1013 TaxID=3417566 RepID=UPI003EBAFE19
MNHDRHRLAFVAEERSFHLTALALDAALAGSPRVKRVMFVGMSLQDDSLREARDIAARHEAHLEDHSVDGPPVAAGSTPLALSTLVHLLSRAERVDRLLYLCPGAIVTGDLSPLLSLDLRDKVIAGARDPEKVKLGYDFVHGKNSWNDVEGVAGLVTPWPIQSYIDTGVLLIDCAAIRRDAALLKKIHNLAAAGALGHDNQDRINLLFKGRILHVNPAWNAPWGHPASRRSWARRCGYRGEETAFRAARIVRFGTTSGPPDMPSLLAPMHKQMERMAYKMAIRSFRLRHPDPGFLSSLRLT